MALISELKGIGSKSEIYLNKLNIFTTQDLLEHYPFRYEFLNETDINEVEDGSRVIVDGIVETKPTLYRFKKGINKLNFEMNVNGNNISIGVFNRAFMANNINLGKKMIIIGKIDKIKNTIVASDIRFGSLKDYNKIEPVYRTTAGLSKKTLSKFIDTALTEHLDEVVDFIPDYLKEEYDFLRKDIALRFIHHPSTNDNIKKATIRLKYEELFMFMLKMNYLKYSTKINKTGIKKEFNQEKISTFIKRLPFALTPDQECAIQEILEDTKSEKRMNRLLQGDVGSGKTVVALVAMYANYLSGFQSALMAPTEVLARQHYQTITKFLKDTNLRVALLLRTTNKKDKNKILKKLEDGEIDIIIGTHALIQENVTYHNLGLVITDEQHRFGVNQRANFKNKGSMVDVLYMSATPIPRTFALTIYGDMEISSIKTMPQGREIIKTYLKNHDQLTSVLEMMKLTIEQKNQVFVVAPLIAESEKSDYENVKSLEEKLTKALGKIAKIGTLHGKMKTEDKTEIMNKFHEGKIDVLISTTVIEVGVDIPNATMMVIFDADRFGLSTLHQLRGRVGRGTTASKCVLVSDKDIERLKIMTTTNDGFEISEFDFKMRGQGDIFGIKQSGDMQFKIADIKQDFKMLLATKKDSFNFLKTEINDPKYKHIKKELLSAVNVK